MRLFLAAFLAAAPAACSSAPTAPRSAQEAFDRIEQRVATAETLSLKFKILAVQAGNVERGETEGSLLVKAGNRVRLETTARVAGPIDTLFLCDGRTMGWQSLGQKNDKPAPSDLGARFLTALARAGAQGVLMEKLRLPGSQEILAPLAFQMQDLREAAEDSLTYTLTVPEAGEFKVRLWYDPRTWNPSRREFRMSREGRDIAITESYEAVDVNGSVPDGRFSLAASSEAAAPVPLRQHRTFDWWSGHQAGSWSKHEGQLIVAGVGKIELTFTLQQVSDSRAVVETREIRTSPRGVREPESVESKVYSKEPEQDPIQVVKEGEEEIDVAGKKLKCRWIEGTKGGNGRVKMWLSREIPGGLARNREFFSGHVSGVLTLTAVAWEKK